MGLRNSKKRGSMLGPIRRFNNIADIVPEAHHLLGGYHPLSGYLAGKARGGMYVQKLEDNFAEVFHVKHAIACNSATSGLLAAAFAVGLGTGDTFVCPAMTMSATAAAPMFTGAMPRFEDVEDETFGLRDAGSKPDTPKAIFVSNLFGHAANLHLIRKFCDDSDLYMIEDNSQSPFATDNGKFAGTIGHIGVFSFNIHKPLQCGEGGMVVTDDETLANRLRAFINHGEVIGGPIGLNLRMPEVSAAIMIAQLEHAGVIIQDRIDQAMDILFSVGTEIPGLRPPITREGCDHVYYTIPFLISGDRAQFCATLKAEGVPIVEGYVEPLYDLPAFSPFQRYCPVAEGLHRQRLFYIENCRYSFTGGQIRMIGEAFKKAAEGIL